MWIKLSDREALTICNQIRDRLMTEDRTLAERLRESDAMAQIMNLAQNVIEKKESKKQ